MKPTMLKTIAAIGITALMSLPAAAQAPQDGSVGGLDLGQISSTLSNLNQSIKTTMLAYQRAVETDSKAAQQQLDQVLAAIQQASDGMAPESQLVSTIKEAMTGAEALQREFKEKAAAAGSNRSLAEKYKALAAGCEKDFKESMDLLAELEERRKLFLEQKESVEASRTFIADAMRANALRTATMQLQALVGEVKSATDVLDEFVRTLPGQEEPVRQPQN